MQQVTVTTVGRSSPSLLTVGLRPPVGVVGCDDTDSRCVGLPGGWPDVLLAVLRTLWYSDAPEMSLLFERPKLRHLSGKHNCISVVDIQAWALSVYLHPFASCTGQHL